MEPAANGDKPSDEQQQFDPSRMIGIIKRKALIKDLAAAYHAECVACCKELLELQRKWEEISLLQVHKAGIVADSELKSLSCVLSLREFSL
uniref:Uncharacterized protein n=1 Tax=Aegilops tauschii TaxID=37682 RepID=M8ATZ7_AEGTA